MKKTVVAVILARSTSSRLPQKQLRHIAGKPLIYHIITRLKSVHNIDRILLATAAEKENKKLGNYCAGLGVEPLYFADEQDVLGRVLLAAKRYPPHILVTILGDCPLVDPIFLEYAINALMGSEAEFVYVDQKKYKCVHEGIEIKTASTWEKMGKLAKAPHHREHINSVMNENILLFKGKEIFIDQIYQRNDLRLSVDTMADLEFMERIFSQFHSQGSLVRLKDVLKYIDENPAIKRFNQYVHQKEILEKNINIGIISHANAQIGMGHLARMIALANNLKESKAANIAFYLEQNTAGEELLDKNGMRYKVWSSFEDLNILIAENMKKLSAFIVDLKQPTYSQFESLFKISEKPVFIIDQIPGVQHYQSILPTIYLSPYLKKISVSKNIFFGKEYLILNRKLEFWRNTNSCTAEGLLITTGGGGFVTAGLLEALSALEGSIKIKFLAGPFANLSKLKKTILKYDIQNFEIIYNPIDPYKIYREAKLAISLFGVTVYELLYLGTPTIVVKTLKKSDEKIVAFMEDKQLCINYCGKKMDKKLGELVKNIYENNQLLENLSLKSKTFMEIDMQKLPNLIYEKI
jgi:spore coat polysaccharide biosynthesis protein SpsF (cytidylyltransferase family)/spore coat polysaccharide biosynthesis predicted glycosyltransferase SpsG